MSTESKDKRSPGRPMKSSEGRRIVFHVSLSPEAAKALEALCRRDIAPIPMSTMVEHLILDRAKGGKP